MKSLSPLSLFTRIGASASENAGWPPLAKLTAVGRSKHLNPSARFNPS